VNDDYEIANRIVRRQRFRNWWLPVLFVDPFRRCPHLFQRGIYGDEIIAAGYKRARCLDCGRLLPHLLSPIQTIGLW
jgi:hypothetical protein